MTKGIQVNSEIGKLRKVLVHRPGAEIENIIPDMMKEMLFDDVPFLKIAQAEHDEFTQLLRERGTETIYIEALLEDILSDPQVKTAFLAAYLKEYQYDQVLQTEIINYFNTLPVAEVVSTVYAGLRKETFALKYETNPFILKPMPNAYFTRDPQAMMGIGLTINKMTFAVRSPESLITEFVVKYHPLFSDNAPVWLDRNQPTRIEGGDELVLNEHTLAIGVSERTASKSIETLAKQLFKHSAAQFDTIIAVEIPHNHAMMHLDTVFTMVNHDQFTVFPGIMDQNHQMNIKVLRDDGHGGMLVEQRTNLKATLQELLNLAEVDLIETGDGDPIVAPREQWNDGSNNLAIAPGEVVTYDRNYKSIEMMRAHGIKVHKIRSSELSRGRGGARCMTQPIWRENLN
ncbi:arginine deiminase [Fructilactobacillus frigidiflavus]|uniref:arginine deiminase n=1 Tax=Fructilactobacillus frigidiflavus TaxID=3242688 RepID=UPI003756BA3A